MNRLDQKFLELKNEGRAALMPYLPLGYPTLEVSQELIRAVADAGADVIEVGIPFSDPLADGPVIQRATQIALQNGITVAKCLEMVRAARARDVTIPLVLMGYYNPILRFGVERFARAARDAGADGVIVADLPVEEAGEVQRACEANDVDFVYLAAPTSTDARLKKIAEATRGFLYLVSLTGVTGAREGLPIELEEFVRRVRGITHKPLCVGFGVANAASAARVAQVGDGVIVGSALVTRIGDAATAVKLAEEFVRELRLVVERRPKAIAG
jgi:tryptophan synthase alpha chain